MREYAEALKEYKAAYVAKPDPAFLFNIGQCYRKLNKNAEALDFFQQFLKKSPPDDPNRAQVEARIRNIEAGVNSDSDPFARADATKPAQPSATETKPDPATVPAMPPQASDLNSARPPPSPKPPATQPSLAAQMGGQPAGMDLTASAPPGESHTSPPIYGTWWFWTGVSAVIVAGTITAIALSAGGGGTKIPGSTLGSRPVFP